MPFSLLGSVHLVISLSKQNLSGTSAVMESRDTELAQQSSTLFRKQWQWLLTKAGDVKYFTGSHEGTDSKCKSEMVNRMKKWTYTCNQSSISCNLLCKYWQKSATAVSREPVWLQKFSVLSLPLVPFLPTCTHYIHTFPEGKGSLWTFHCYESQCYQFLLEKTKDPRCQNPAYCTGRMKIVECHASKF